jgi:3-deoxy-D-manno-octulosonic-acid transferase
MDRGVGHRKNYLDSPAAQHFAMAEDFSRIRCPTPPYFTPYITAAPVCGLTSPHFTDTTRVSEIKNRFEPNAVTLKDLLENPALHAHKKVLIIDRIGWLANLYQYADVAFIGGGFKDNGLHNILEAATFGMPICFGPKIDRFPEAKEMVSLKLASVINNENDLKTWLTFHENNTAESANQSLKCRQWIQSKTGATQTILNWIQIHLLSS